jgi:hypothetical protein
VSEIVEVEVFQPDSLNTWVKPISGVFDREVAINLGAQVASSVPTSALTSGRLNSTETILAKPNDNEAAWWRTVSFAGLIGMMIPSP